MGGLVLYFRRRLVEGHVAQFSRGFVKLVTKAGRAVRMSKRRSEVVPAPKGISNYVAKQWEKGATNQNYVLVDVKQVI